MDQEIHHTMLVAAGDFDEASHKILRFFTLTQLIKYQTIIITESASMHAGNPRFWEVATKGMETNRTLLQEMLDELAAAGFGQTRDMVNLERGYLSKVFHTTAHLLDGFFGIDSCFYNLEEDSHWISANYKRLLEAAPKQHWLIHVKAQIDAESSDPLMTLRSPLSAA